MRSFKRRKAVSTLKLMCIPATHSCTWPNATTSPGASGHQRARTPRGCRRACATPGQRPQKVAVAKVWQPMGSSTRSVQSKPPGCHTTGLPNLFPHVPHQQAGRTQDLATGPPDQGGPPCRHVWVRPYASRCASQALRSARGGGFPVVHPQLAPRCLR